MIRFKEKIPAPVFLFMVLFFPFVYLLVQILWREMPFFLWQILFLIFPFTVLVVLYPLENAFEWKGYAKKFLIVTVLALVATYLNNFLAAWWDLIVPMPDEVKQAIEAIFHQEWGAWGWAYDLFQIALLAAIGEELFFRGVVFVAMLEKMNPYLAMFLSSLIFAAFHMNPWQFPFLFLLGFLFAYIFYKTKNLTLAMLFHFINNAIGVWLYYQYGY